MKRGAGAGILALFLAAGTAGAQPASPVTRVPDCVLEYAREFDRVRNAPRPAPIEHLFRLGTAVGDSLTRDSGSPNDFSTLAAMDDSTFDRASHLVPGFTLLRDEVEGVLVDPDVFLALAIERGDSADLEFFRALEATMDSSYLPVYVEQVTDYSGCTRFGSGSLVETYTLWRRFMGRHPGRYAERARHEFDGVLETLLTNDCPCTDRASVVRELELFLDRFPGDSGAVRVRERLGRVRSGRESIRENCRPG